MEYQSFRGASLGEALGRVRTELGADALIASTRHVAPDAEGGSAQVEVLAATGGRRTGASSVRAPAKRVRRSAVERSPAGGPEERQELARLRRMIEELSHNRAPKDRTGAQLASAGFEGKLAGELARGATQAAKAGGVRLRALLRERLARRLTAKPGLIGGSEPQAIACVGPTGVGKTTTLAKFAAVAALQLGKSVAVVSLDTFRVGATEQWHRFADLIGFSFDVADNAGTFHRLVHTRPYDLLLVDTAGASAAEGQGLLETCMGGLASATVDVLLVLPAWLRGWDAEQLVTQYTGPPLTGVVITKLDETDQLGGALHAPVCSGLPVTHLCDGARVPEDVRDASQEQLLDLIFPEPV